MSTYDAKKTSDPVMTLCADGELRPVSRRPSARKAADPQFQAQLDGYSLTTAEITYRLPDAPSLLQTFLWQEYDMAPRFPKLGSFLQFWERELDGPIHSVRVASAKLLRPLELRAATDLTVH